MYAINRLYNCGIFQGDKRHKHYFEGWYFKHVDKEEKNIIAIIPGVSYEDGRDKAHSFIQIIDGSTYNTHYIKYGINEFKFSKKRFEFEIGGNIFSQRGISLDIARDGLSIFGSLSYNHFVSWQTGVLSPSSMGWYAFVPVMECYHGVLSLQHQLSGSLTIGGRELSFDKGVGYMEKDWGTSFPSSWIWLQSNHFDTQNTSFMLSVAKIPWHGKSFTGFIIGLWHDGSFYKFATYTGAQLEALNCNGSEVELKLMDRSYYLSVKAKQGKTGGLQAPVKGAMVGMVQEGISGTAEILLKDKKTGRDILNTKARCCGMEVAGKIQELVSLP